MTNVLGQALSVLEQACFAAGLSVRGAEPIRIAENQTWRLPRGLVVRVAPSGQGPAAAREVRVARWLVANGVPVVRPIDLEQPVEADGRPVTFWEEVPPHEHGTVSDVALLLKELHALPRPDFDIGHLDPFVRIPERLKAAATLSDNDRRWLEGLHQELAERWASGLPDGMPECAIHGDAWPGNIVRVGAKRLMMDLERFSIGPPEWDLISTAVRARTTGAVTQDEYMQFCTVYGYDVTDWAGSEVLAGARELRMVTYAAQHAATNPDWRDQAQFRVDCLRGRYGPRPWRWRGIL